MTGYKHIIGALALASILPQAALAGTDANTGAKLATTQGGHTPTGTLRIDMPAGTDVMALTTLGVELDGIDITAMLELDKEDFTYTPIEPLKPGRHKLRLMKLEGAPVEQAAWDFTVEGAAAAGNAEAEAEAAPTATQEEQAEAWLRSTSFESDNSINLTHRLTEAGNTSSLPHRTNVSGAGTFNASHTSGKWNTTANGNYFVESQRNISVSGEEADLGEYLFSTQYQGDEVVGGLNAGHHTLGIDSLLFSPENRRGISLNTGMADGRAGASLFAFRPDSIVGAEDISGMTRHDNRIQGSMMQFKPLSNAADALRLTTLYYTGEGVTSGFAASEAPATATQTATGDGWGLLADKSFLEGRLLLKGEVNGANHDADGDLAALPEHKGNAIAGLAELRPFEAPVIFGKSADVLFGLKQERVDTFFTSLASPSLAPDRNTTTLYNNLMVGQWTGGITLMREENNVDDRADLPTNRLHSVQLDNAYYFNPQEGALSWLGTPFVNGSVQLATVDRLETPLGYTGAPSDFSTRIWTLGGGAQYQDISWNLSHSISEMLDNPDTTQNHINHMTSLAAYYRVEDYLTLTASGQIGSTHLENDRQDLYDQVVSLGAYAVLIEDVLNLNVQYDMNVAAGDTDSLNDHSFNTELEWVLKKAEQNKPGVSLALSSIVEDTNGSDTVANNDTDYQLFLSLRLYAPVAWYH